MRIRIYLILCTALSALLPSLPMLAQEPFVSERINSGLHVVAFDARTQISENPELLFAQHAPSRTLKSGNHPFETTRWIDRIYNIPDYLIDFYNQYGLLIQQVLDGTDNSLSEPTLSDSLDEYTYGIPIRVIHDDVYFKYNTDATQEQIFDITQNMMGEIADSTWKEVNAFMNYLTLCLTYDNPEAFWLQSSFRWSYAYSYGYRTNGQGDGTIEYDLVFHFVLKQQDFDHRRNEFTKRGAVKEACTEYHSLLNGVLNNCPNGNRYEKIVYFNDWLTKHNCYNSQFMETNTAPTIAWSPLAALRGSTGTQGPVCEGYARAFKILCDKSGIPCVLAVGNAKSYQYAQGEPHMWNEVKMENGSWYAVDVTWNDPTVNGNNQAVSGQENDNWLLIGSNSPVPSPSFTFAQSHPLYITWDIAPQFISQWDYDVHSLITSQKYDPKTSVTSTFLPGDYLQVYDLLGRHIGTHHPSTDLNSILEPGIYLINGRKFSIQ